MNQRLRFSFIFVFLLILTACQTNQPQTLAITPTPTAVSTTRTETTDQNSPTPPPTTAPTAVPNHLAWEPFGDVSLDNFPPGQPFVIQFNQPMDTAVPQPLIFSPPARGKFEWSNNNIRLTFTPNEPLTINRNYWVNLHASIKSQTGIQFDSVQRWQLRTQNSPQVNRLTPNTRTITTYQPTFALRFKNEMEKESVLDALSMSPHLPHTAQWDGITLNVSIDAPLAFGTEYTLTIDDTAVDTDGRPLAEPFIWTTQLADPLASVTWPTTTNHLSNIVLQFNYPLDQASLNDALEIKPAINGKLSWNSDYTKVELTPDKQLPTDTTYTISFTNPLRDAAGGEIPTPAPIDFTSPPAILAATPKGSSNHPADSIKVRFDRPMDAATAEAAFHIEPVTEGSFSWEETTLVFQPELGYLAPDTDYKVTISQTALSAAGEIVLNNDYVWNFTTKQWVDVANFGYGPNAQILDANGRRAIQFQALRRDSLTFTFQLFQLEMTQFLDRYSAGFHGWVWDDSETNHISIEGAELLTQWQTNSTRRPHERANVQETTLPEDVPPGLYILNLIAGSVNDQLILVVTENNIAVKQADEQLLAWVTDIHGDAVPNASVTVYARNGNIITSGQANADGLYETILPAFSEGGPPATEPLIIAAQVGDDVTLTGLSHEWRSSSGFYDWQSEHPADAQSAAFVFTERPIYKPGQLVYFKAIVRLDEDALLSVPPEGTAVSVRIRDSRNNVVQTQDLFTNSFGSINGQFQIAEGASLGAYTVEATYNGTAHSQIFKVEDYRKPDYEVTVTSDAAAYIKGDTAEITIDTAYFFGEPVANAQVTIRRFQVSPDWYTPNLFTWYKLYGVAALHGETDANGRFTTSIPLSGDHLYFDQVDWNSSLKQIQWGIEATVDDGSHQTVSGHAIITIYDAAEQLTIESSGFVQEPERPFNINATVQTVFGEPMPNRTLQLSLRRWSSTSYNYDTVVQSAELTTNENGRANLNFTISEPGYYQLHIKGEDSQGNDINATSWVYAFSNFYSSWYGRDNGTLHLEADQTEYQPGDVAQILVESTFSGPALLTVERGTIRREELVQLTAPVTMIPVTIEEGDTPNVYVAVNVWNEQDTTLTGDSNNSLPESRLETGYVNLSVPAFTKRLNVAITPDKAEYTPGEEATFTVRVTNYRGEPVSAELSLALVDEAIFGLSPELNGLMYDSFYYERGSRVNTYNSMHPVRHLWQGGWGGGGSDGGAETGGPRQDFPDTAVWEPTLQTDFNGEASVTITLPDTVTSWRATAKATTADTQVGETTANVITKQDVIVRPLLPRILTTGDTMALSAIVHNYGDVTQELAVELTIDDLRLTIEGASSQTITLQPGEQQIVGWPVEAKAAGEVDVLITAVPTNNNNAIADAIQLPLIIQPLAIPDVTTEVGQFSTRYETSITVPADALPMSHATIQLSRSIAGSMLEGLEYLTGYPYGCVEQTMSKALPNAVVGRALNQLGVTNPTLQGELPGQINASIQRLYGFQHNDGGWGWWYDDNTDAYQTAWVIFGLAQVAEAGYEIDPAVIERGVNWLNQEPPATVDARTRAFAYYAMALAGMPNEELTLNMAENAHILNGDEFSLAALALALHEMGEDEMAAELLTVLDETAVSQDNFTYWQGAHHDGYYNNKVMASDVRTTAIALSAYSQIQPSSDKIPGMVHWLMTQRRSQGWGTTNETSFAILGLTDHLLATSYGEAANNTSYTVQINGQTVANGTLGRGEPSVSLTIPLDELTIGENEVVLTQSGSQQLYFVLNGRMFVPHSEIEAAGNVTVTRRYLDGETGQPLETIEPGQLVQIRLTINFPDQASYVIIEDKLPGGLEALNEGLATSSHIADAYNGPQYRWQQLGYNHKEVHSDRVSFFITEMQAATKTITYYARATHAGSFTAMPTEVYAMYDPAVWGRSASNQLTIVD